MLTPKKPKKERVFEKRVSFTVKRKYSALLTAGILQSCQGGECVWGGAGGGTLTCSQYSPVTSLLWTQGHPLDLADSAPSRASGYAPRTGDSAFSLELPVPQKQDPLQHVT